ncbi:restriction endonuclease subunit S [Fibrobacter sp. UWB13]|uniref:restriction endonuclease subunit S n=1 Tax=Fibrobacter sp. UWB13 TaxID=1896204 RepID=UPI000A0C8FCE|nr:restriction endonuclease subunit S [Fibrobacter sp. UWB13]SMG14463.1 type I restriction enzyme, S subunit [Fibrobacter sp. UWB13]
MKRNWEYKNIEECLEKVTVVSKLQTKDFLSKGKFPIVSQEVDYISGYWNNDSDVVRLLHPVVVFGDHSRVVKYIDFDFVVGADGVKILSPKDFLNPKFLYYFVKSADIPSLGYSRHYKLLREKDVPVPPLEEQSRIIAELDLLTGIIDKQNAQLKELNNLAQAIFYDMFGDPIENPKGWEVNKLGDVCLSITDGDHMPPPKVNRGIPFLTISDIDKETRMLNFEDTFYVPQEYFNSLKNDRKAQVGDLLYTVTGSYGIPVVVTEKRDFCFQRHIALLRPKKEFLNTYFLCYWALCKSVKLMADGVATGIAQKTVGLGSIRKFDVILPPLTLQQSFAEKIQSIEKQKETIRASIADTQKLLDYTMDKYFG